MPIISQTILSTGALTY